MEARQISRLLMAGVAFALVYGIASSPHADDAKPADPFASVEAIQGTDLDDLRGGDTNVYQFIDEDITTTATNTSTSTIGTMTFNTSGGPGGPGGPGGGTGGTGGAGGSIIAGNVYYNDNALQNFGGVYTSAINTAPGGMSTAQTTATITLYP